MRGLAVDDHHALHALFERVDAGLDLRDHAAGNGAVGDQPARILDRQFRNQLLRLVEHARHVGQQQQPLRLQRARDRARKSVGIDVKSLASGRGGKRRQHRDQLMADQLVEQRQIDFFGFADKAEVDHLFDARAGIDHGAGRLGGGHHVAVLAAQADRLAAGFIDVADQLLVDRTGQHHLDNLDGGAVGDAQPGGEFRLDAEPLQHGGDLRPAAMDHHRIDGGLLQQHDIARERLGGLLRPHRVATIFDDDGFLVILLHMGQRFREDTGLLERADLGRVGHRESRDWRTGGMGTALALCRERSYSVFVPAGLRPARRMAGQAGRAAQVIAPATAPRRPAAARRQW